MFLIQIVLLRLAAPLVIDAIRRSGFETCDSERSRYLDSSNRIRRLAADAQHAGGCHTAVLAGLNEPLLSRMSH